MLVNLTSLGWAGQWPTSKAIFWLLRRIRTSTLVRQTIKIYDVVHADLLAWLSIGRNSTFLKQVALLWCPNDQRLHEIWAYHVDRRKDSQPILSLLRAWGWFTSLHQGTIGSRTIEQSSFVSIVNIFCNVSGKNSREHITKPWIRSDDISVRLFTLQFALNETASWFDTCKPTGWELKFKVLLCAFLLSIESLMSTHDRRLISL